MIITAKFASVCPCCSIRIVAGSKVEWSKGSPARHVACSAAPGARIVASTPARVTSTYRPAARWTGCRCGSREDEPRDSDCRQCRYDNE